MTSETWDRINKAVEHARKKHPNWPTDLVHQSAILAEESGEATKAALDATYSTGSVADFRDEVLQVAAVCVRILERG